MTTPASLTILNPVVLNGVLNEIPNPIGLKGITLMGRTGYPFPTVTYDVVGGSRAMAKANIPNSEAHIVKPLPEGQISFRMLYTREKKVLDATTLYWLRTPGDFAKKQAEDKVRRELEDLNERNEKFLEYCIWQMLTGTLTINQPDVKVSIDYRIKPSHKPTATVLWSHKDGNGNYDADIEADVRSFKQLISNDGNVSAETVYLNSNTLQYIYKNADVRGLLSDRMKDQYLTTSTLPNLFGINWIEYDGSYVDDSNNTQYYIPDGKLVMLSKANKFAEVMEGPSADHEAEGRTGKFTKSWEEKDPSARQMLVEYTFAPALYRPDQVVFATVG